MLWSGNALGILWESLAKSRDGLGELWPGGRMLSNERKMDLVGAEKMLKLPSLNMYGGLPGLLITSPSNGSAVSLFCLVGPCWNCLFVVFLFANTSAHINFERVWESVGAAAVR